MKTIALLTLLLNFSTYANFDYSFNCKNTAALDNGMKLELNNTGEAVLTYNDQKYYLTTISHNRTNINFKSETGSLLAGIIKKKSIELQNLDDTISVNYQKISCRAL